MRFAFISVALLASSVASSATPIDGWYTEVFGGYTYLPNNVNNLGRSNATYWSGYDAGGKIGYKNNPMRYEAEFTYLNAGTKKFNVFNIQQTGVSGQSDAFLAMANAYYDFHNLVDVIQPFLGFGIGYAWVNATLNSTGPLGATQFTESNTVFAYQGTAGLTYNFAENYALNIGYRYVATVNAQKLGKMFQANLASIGAIYRFDEGRYK